jgi:hypothetical protein
MKTSNIALIALVFTCAFLVISVPLFIHYQLHFGNFSRLQSDQNFDFDRRDFGGIRVVSLTGIHSGLIVPDDSLHVDIERVDSPELLISVTDDTLKIMAKDNSSQRVRIFLPSAIRVLASHSGILVRGALDSFDSLQMHIDLSDSRMVVAPVFKDERVPQFWEHLVLSGADSTTVDFSGGAMIHRLDVQNINELKLGDRIYVGELTVSYRNKQLVHSTSNDSGLIVQGF